MRIFILTTGYKAQCACPSNPPPSPSPTGSFLCSSHTSLLCILHHWAFLCTGSSLSMKCPPSFLLGWYLLLLLQILVEHSSPDKPIISLTAFPWEEGSVSLLMDPGRFRTALTKGSVEVMLRNFWGWVIRCHKISTLLVRTAVLRALSHLTRTLTFPRPYLGEAMHRCSSQQPVEFSTDNQHHLLAVWVRPSDDCSHSWFVTQTPLETPRKNFQLSLSGISNSQNHDPNKMIVLSC